MVVLLLLLPPLRPFLPPGDSCGIASDRCDVEVASSPELFADVVGVDGTLDSSADFVFGANDTLRLAFPAGEFTTVEEALWSSCSLRDNCSGDKGCSEAFGERVSDSKDAAFRTSSSSFESVFRMTLASLDSLGGVLIPEALPTLLPPGLRLAREAKANAEANSVGSTFFLSDGLSMVTPSIVSF